MNHRERTDTMRESLTSHVREKSSCTRKWILPGLLVLILLLTGCGTLRTGTGGINNPTRAPSNEISSAETVPETSLDSAPTSTPAKASEEASKATPVESSDEYQEPTPAESSEEYQEPTLGESSDDDQTPASAESQTETAEASVSGTAASKTPDDSSPPDSGILVKSGNELSSEEKQKLLEELEKELDALFTEINDVSAEEEMEAQN